MDWGNMPARRQWRVLQGCGKRRFYSVGNSKQGRVGWGRTFALINIKILGYWKIKEREKEYRAQSCLDIWGLADWVYCISGKSSIYRNAKVWFSGVAQHPQAREAPSIFSLEICFNRCKQIRSLYIAWSSISLLPMSYITVKGGKHL